MGWVLVFDGREHGQSLTRTTTNMAPMDISTLHPNPMYIGVLLFLPVGVYLANLWPRTASLFSVVLNPLSNRLRTSLGAKSPRNLRYSICSAMV